MDDKKIKAIILLGAPGAGKGTQANLLAEKLNLYHLETSCEIERFFKSQENDIIELDNKKYSIKEEKKKWTDGLLVSPPFVISLMKRKIKEKTEQGISIVFSGSPRSMFEVKELMPFLNILFGNNVKIFFLKLSCEQSVWRNSHRRICELMRHPILYSEETEKLTCCPFDGSRLIKRALDTPETIKKRFKVFENRTFPVIQHLKEQRFKVNEINGEQTVANVHYDILKSIIPN